MLRCALTTIALLCTLTACPAPPEDVVVDTCTARTDAVVCDSDRACVGGFCERANIDDACGVCRRLVCVVDADCDPGQVCDVERARCEPAGACELFGARAGCDGDALCAPIDDVTQCVAPDVAACEVVPAVVMVNDGRAALVEVLALDERGRPLPVVGDVTLPANLDGVARCDGDAPCRDVVTATVQSPGGDVTCTAPSIVLPDLVAGARVVVRDIDTGAPVEGAAVVVDGTPAQSDADGIALFPGIAAASIEYARADAAGFETTVIVAPGANDVEVLLARVAAPGTVAGKRFEMNTERMRLFADIRLGLGTLSPPDLVDALDSGTLAGPPLVSTFELQGITEPGGTPVIQPSAATLALGDNTIFNAGVAIGRPGTRLLSMLGGQVALANAGPVLSAWATDDDENNDGIVDVDVNGDGVINDDDRIGIFDGVIGLWNGSQGTTAFDLAGSVSTTEAALDDERGLAAFDDGSSVEARPAIDTTDEIDVIVPPLADGHDAAFVALYARVPGRGFVLLALRFANDLDEDGRVDPGANGPFDDGLVRLFVAPSLWTTDRDLVVVAGSQRSRDLRDGVLGTNRVSAPVTSMSARTVLLPPFRADTPALIEADALVTLTTPRDGGLLSLHGTVDDAPFRVIVAGDDATVELARYGLDAVDAGSLRVWRIDATPTFAAGTLGVARALASPSTAVSLR